MSIEVKTNSVEVEADTTEIGSGFTDAVISTENSAYMEITPAEYALTSGGIYGGGNLIGTVPVWLQQAIQKELTTGDGNLTDIVDGISAFMLQLEAGVTQSIQSINTSLESNNSLITTVNSKVDNNQAYVTDILTTKVDGNQALAIAVQQQESVFGADAIATINSVAATYTSPTSAIAQDLDLVRSTLDGVSSSVTEVAQATTEYVENPAWVDDGSQTDPDALGHDRYILQAKAFKQIEVNANGIITGLILESGDTSSTTFNTDIFKIQGSTTGYSPFKIDTTTGKIAFTGDVRFEGLGLSGTSTSIDGGKITTNSITAGHINTMGLVAENISATHLYGLTLEGSSIIGAVIRASYLDLDGELEVLTNYHITQAMYDANPSLYTDTVYLSGLGEYRIPSASTVNSYGSVVSIPSTATLSTDTAVNTTITTITNSGILPYNCANAGHNIKAVKARPDALIIEPVELFVGGMAYYDIIDAVWSMVTLEIRMGDMLLFTITFDRYSVGSSKYAVRTTMNTTSANPPYDSPCKSTVTKEVNGIICTATATTTSTTYVGTVIAMSITISKYQNTPLSFDFSSTAGAAITLQRTAGVLPISWIPTIIGAPPRVYATFNTVTSSLNNMI